MRLNISPSVRASIADGEIALLTASCMSAGFPGGKQEILHVQSNGPSDKQKAARSVPHSTVKVSDAAR